MGQQFRNGTSFRRVDDGNLLSHDLACIRVAQMGRAWPAFERFALAAERRDAGAASARTHLGLDLGACVRLLVDGKVVDAWRGTERGDDQLLAEIDKAFASANASSQ